MIRGEEKINLFDLVTVSGRLCGDNGKFYQIQKEGSDMNLLESTFCVGDSVFAFLDGKMEMADKDISKIYIISSLSGNKISVRERTGSDFGFDGGIRGEHGFFFGGDFYGGKALTLEKADADQVKIFDKWFVANSKGCREGYAQYEAALEALVLSFPKTNLSIETVCSHLRNRIAKEKTL